MPELTDQQRGQINAHLFQGRKIEAIKVYREAMGGELVDAKKAVDAIEQDLRQREPKKFAKTKSGCVGVLVTVAVLVSATLVTIYILR
jgi:ribosomal protein L7/L12